MSRHRDVRNMTEDDIYDYQDDYYDEDDEDYEDYDNGYTKEENDIYYRQLAEQKAAEEAAKKKKLQQQQQQNKQKQPQKQKPKEGVKISLDMNNKKKAPGISSTPSTSNNNKEEAEKLQLVTAMGFSSIQGKLALQNHSWDAESAINDLLTSPEKYANLSDTSTTNTSTAASSSAAASGGISIGYNTMAPPSGWKKPQLSEKSINKDNKVTAPKAKAKATPSKKTTNNITITPPKPKSILKPKKKLSKELQESLLKGQKSRLSMVILGHVDAGKSTLMGQVLVQLGIVQKRIVTKYQKQAAQIGKQSFALAWVMDEDESERERGVTIDIATKYISTNTHDLTILDAPGHADFVPAMITGAAAADVGILVIASTPGEFESGFDDTTKSGCVKGHVGQTREHITLARGLGVTQLIVAVNKLDAAEPSWSQYRFIEIKKRLVPFLKTNGFDMKRVQFVPISGLSGVNVKTPPSMEDISSAGLASWYKDQTLMQAIDRFEPAKRNIDKPFRFLASDIYSEGKFVIVKGRVAQGLISVGDKIVILPIGDIADVGRIEHGIAPSGDLIERMSVAMAGDSVELYLTGIDIARISVGNIISDVDESLRPKLKRKMTAKIMVMDRLTVPLITGSQVLLHMHSLDVPAVISNLISRTNRKDGSISERPRVLTGGANAMVEIKLKEKICLEVFSDCRALGRFALRRNGDTVAVGMVESLI